jgi:hypothetical protein
MSKYADEYGSFFGRLNEDGNVIVLHETGEAATRLDANVYPVGSQLSARNEHAAGIVLSRADAARLGLGIEDDSNLLAGRVILGS